MKTCVIRTRTAVRRFTGIVLRAVRRAWAAFAEFNRQQMRLTERRFAQDVYAPGAVPATYAEFLFRTRGSLAHEPSARARLDGHPVH